MVKLPDDFVHREGVSFDMAHRIACFTLDLEPDLYSKDSHEVLLDSDRFGQIEAFFARNQLKLTTFVGARMLEIGLPVREKLSNIDTEFELHSYSHNAREPDTEQEILRAKEAYLNYFGRSPRGYRAPNGDISCAGLEILHREGFLYDASVFPSWRPELGFNYGHLPTKPWIYAEFPRLVEIPFAVVPTIRIVVSFSFLKLFGLSFYRIMFSMFGLPEILVFDSHLHDFIPPESIRRLPRSDWRRSALMRNGNNTFYLLQGFVDFLRSKGYSFVSMNDLYESLVGSNHDVPVIPANGLRESAYREQRVYI
jgi:peptidoglycan/xylan/chitin deacetylase (PgdA/CDA1 family)